MASGDDASRSLIASAMGPARACLFTVSIASSSSSLLDNDGVALRNGAEETLDFTQRLGVEATCSGAFLKTDCGSSEITADSLARDFQLSSNPFTAEAFVGELVDPIHDFRLQHPGVLLRRSQADIRYIHLVHLRVMQIDHIGPELVHNPSQTNVQAEGGTFSVVRGLLLVSPDSS